LKGSPPENGNALPSEGDFGRIFPTVFFTFRHQVRNTDDLILPVLGIALVAGISLESFRTHHYQASGQFPGKLLGSRESKSLSWRFYWLLEPPPFSPRTLLAFPCRPPHSENLDWLAAARVHPVNDAVSKFLNLVAFVLRLQPLCLAAFAPVLRSTRFTCTRIYLGVTAAFAP